MDKEKFEKMAEMPSPLPSPRRLCASRHSGEEGNGGVF